MNRGRKRGIAVEPIPYGSRVRVAAGQCRRAATNEDMNGIARRRWGAGDVTRYEMGEEVDVETQGSILMVDGDNSRTVQLEKGKIVE